MANITTLAINTATGSPGNFDASVMWLAGSSGGNLQRIAYQVNGNLNSVNFKTSSFLSQHFNTQVVNSMHVANNAILSAKLTDNAILERHMDYRSTSAGVRVLRVGQAGLKIARVNVTIAEHVDSGDVGFSLSYRCPFSGSTSGVVSNASIQVSYTASALDGNVGFTTTPLPLTMPAPLLAGAAVRWADKKVLALNSLYIDIDERDRSGTTTGTDTNSGYRNVIAVGY